MPVGCCEDQRVASRLESILQQDLLAGVINMSVVMEEVVGCPPYGMGEDDALVEMLIKESASQDLMQMITMEKSVTTDEMNDITLDDNHNDMLTVMPVNITPTDNTEDEAREQTHIHVGTSDTSDQDVTPMITDAVDVKAEVTTCNSESDAVVVAKEECQDSDADVDAEGSGDAISDVEDAERVSEKPGLSYIALISLAIQSSPDSRMLLSEIYRWIAKKYPYFRSQDRSWRNSVRHNLSLNECFVKAGRAENGKGHYWAIHPANQQDFAAGDFRRRHARRRVRSAEDQDVNKSDDRRPTVATSCEQNVHSDQYVPMTMTHAPTHALVAMFGEDAVYGPANKRHYLHYHNMHPVVDFPPFTPPVQFAHILPDVTMEQNPCSSASVINQPDGYIMTDAMSVTSPSARERPSCMFA